VLEILSLPEAVSLELLLGMIISIKLG